MANHDYRPVSHPPASRANHVAAWPAQISWFKIKERVGITFCLYSQGNAPHGKYS